MSTLTTQQKSSSDSKGAKQLRLADIPEFRFLKDEVEMLRKLVETYGDVVMGRKQLEAARRETKFSHLKICYNGSNN